MWLWFIVYALQKKLIRNICEVTLSNKRKSISKRIRFEILKRDKFACQYCGEKAPNVILHIDHINPVSKGGTNDIMNLITSCFGCNSGKSNIKLQDDAVVTKQHQQMAMLQERREQIDLMFQWRQELDRIDDDLMVMVIEYIETKIDHFSVNDVGRKTIQKHTKKFKLADILEAIDISAATYLQLDTEGGWTSESAANFFDKIGGILVNKSKPPIEQKLAYIKGICRNIFSYWNVKTGSILLNNYVSALRNQGWDDNRILEDLETELIEKTKKCQNWSQWRSLLEAWIQEVNNWEHQEPEKIESYENPSVSDIDAFTTSLYKEIINMIPALSYMGKVFDNFSDDGLEDKILGAVLNQILAFKKYYTEPHEERESHLSFYKSYSEAGIMELFTPIDSYLHFHLENAATTMLYDIRSKFEDYTHDSAVPNTFDYMAMKFEQLLKNGAQ